MGGMQLKTLTVRISNEEEREAIRYVMRESGCGRAAQAMIFACTAYYTSNERYKSVLASVQNRSRVQNRNQQRVINSLMAENERLRRMLKVMQDGLANLNNTMQQMQQPVPSNSNLNIELSDCCTNSNN